MLLSVLFGDTAVDAFSSERRGCMYYNTVHHPSYIIRPLRTRVPVTYLPLYLAIEVGHYPYKVQYYHSSYLLNTVDLHMYKYHTKCGVHVLLYHVIKG